MPNSWNTRCSPSRIFYKSLSPGNKVLADQLIPGCIAQQPYMITAQRLDHMAKTNQEVERDFMLTALVTQLDDLTNKISEIEIQCKGK